MKRPRVLDLFCGAGGAAMGIHRAWPNAQITGVDIIAQKNYPFDFIQADAMDYSVDGYDFIWASPVCKRYTIMAHYGNNRHSKPDRWPDQIHHVRVQLQKSGIPYVIENVTRAPLETDAFLCGQMFGLPLIRHRLFETSFFWLRPFHKCADRGCTIRKEVFTITGHGGGRSPSNQRLNWKAADGRRAMGIDWMTRAEMAEAVPPVYSEYIIRQFVSQMSARRHTTSKF